MKTDKDGTDREEIAIERLFAAANAERPLPTDAFMARLHGDAIPPATSPEGTGSAQSWRFRLGGFLAASGLAGAAALGVVLGFVMPDLVEPFRAGDDTIALYSFLPGADLSAVLEE